MYCVDNKPDKTWPITQAINPRGESNWEREREGKSERGIERERGKE